MAILLKKKQELTREEKQNLYKLASQAKSGMCIKCPNCGIVFETSNGRIFCSTFCRESYRQFMYQTKPQSKFKRYKKRPIIIEAVQWNGSNYLELIEFAGIKVLKINNSNEKELLVQTLEGTMIASKGDYIIKGIKGEFYPCKPDIFEETYIEVKGTK